jgi:hypothetical protein
MTLQQERSGFWSALAWDGQGNYRTIRLCASRETARLDALAAIDEMTKGRATA